MQGLECRVLGYYPKEWRIKGKGHGYRNGSWDSKVVSNVGKPR